MNSIAPGARGQPVQIGVLLLFAFLVIGLGLFQAVLVPQENGQVEFNHNKLVQDDMVDLRSDLLRAASTGESRTTQVQLGTTYPSRTLLLNPAPPAGTLRSTYRGNLSVRNARATSSTGVADFWDGDSSDDPSWAGTDGRHTFRTNAVLYEPAYNVYNDAPETVFEGSVLYNRFAEDAVTLSTQTFISSRTISLTAIQGEYSESTARAVTVDPRVVSTANRTITVTDSSGPVEIRVPTRLSEDTWREILSSEIGPATDQYVTGVSVDETADMLTVTLERGVDYNLRLGAVGIGSRGPTAAAEHDPEYLVVTGGDGNSIDEGDTQQLTVEVRDRYNNPAAAETVTIRQPTVGYIAGSDGDPNAPVTVTTDQNGRATVTYAAPRNVERNQPADVPVTVAGGDPDNPGTDPKTVEFRVNVEDNAEAVDNAEYERPLLTAVEPSPGGSGSASAEFARIYVPAGASSGDYYLEDSSGTRSDELTNPAEGTYYFSDSTLTGPCQNTMTQNLNFDLAGTETVTLVRESGGTTQRRDRLAYDEGTTFEADGLGVRVEEDDAYVDSNVSSVDWTTATATEACTDGGTATTTTSAEQVEFGGNPGSQDGPSTGSGNTGDTIAVFDIENTGTVPVEVANFTVYRNDGSALAGSGNSDYTRLVNDGTPGDEFVVDPGGGLRGAADADDGSPAGRNYFSITEPYAFAEFDTNAELNGGATATVQFGEFVSSNGGVYDGGAGWAVQQVGSDSTDTDIVVSLRFADGSTKRFYISTE
jgi:hypothetical protein